MMGIRLVTRLAMNRVLIEENASLKVICLNNYRIFDWERVS
jgi:hypothetical protein